MIIVTGGAGFIGSNLVRALNRIGEEDILIVDNLSSPEKEQNISDLKFVDYLDKEEIKRRVLMAWSSFKEGTFSSKKGNNQFSRRSLTMSLVSKMDPLTNANSSKS